MPRLIPTLCAVLLTPGLNAALMAAPRPMTPVDLLDLPSLASGRLSPDGTRLVYTRSESDWSDNYRRSTVWVADTESGDTRQLLHRRADVGSLCWSPEGGWLAFTADGEGGRSDQAYLLPLDGGDAYQLTEHPTSVRDLVWSPGSDDYLYFRATEERPDTEPEVRSLIRPHDTPTNSQLWRVRTSNGRREQLTDGSQHVRGYHATPDGLLVLRSKGSLIDDRHGSSTIWRMEPDGTNPRRLAGPRHTMGQARLAPGGGLVLYLADVNAAGEAYYETNLFVFDTTGERAEHRELLADFPHEIEQAAWGPTAETIFFSANLGVHSQLFELTVATGEARQLTEGDHELREWNYQGEQNAFVLQLRTSRSAGDMWLLAAPSAEEAEPEPRPLTREFESLPDEFQLPEQRVIRYAAADGVEVEALLTLPTDGSTPPYPLVVQSHGGPRSSIQYGLWRWGNYQPVLAGRGWATLSVNYRGSTGYGEAFHRDMVGNYWRNAHTDVLAGVEHLVGEGIADTDRVVAMGWSAGGHMTNKLITVTDRFKAASSGAGAVDWVSMYGESDTRFNRAPWFGGSPWQEGAPLDAFRKQSPLYEMWKAKTPTLIFVGEEDRRVPRTQSILMARALRDAGVPSHLYIAPGQGHGWSRLDQRLFKINRELEWFERHARGRDYEWQAAPDED